MLSDLLCSQRASWTGPSLPKLTAQSVKRETVASFKHVRPEKTKATSGRGCTAFTIPLLSASELANTKHVLRTHKGS